MTARHTILGGKVQLYQRPRSPFWQAEATVAGVQLRKSTKTDSLSQASDVAEDWYLNLRGKDRWGGGIAKGKTFRKAAAKFLEEFEVLTNGERNPKYVEALRIKIEKHINPFMGDKPVNEITDSVVQDYRVMRAKAVDEQGNPKPPSRTSIHHEIIAIRHVLKTARRQGWIAHLPDLSPPYRGSGKVSHRAWFSPEEYRHLYQKTRERARNPSHPKWRWECEQFHDYVLFMANTGLRPDEAARLAFEDVVIVDDDATDDQILLIKVRRGKRGAGWCKSMPGAVRPFERLRDRARGLPEERSPITRDRRQAPPPGGRPYSTEPKRTRGHGGLSQGHGAEMALPGPRDLIFGPTQRQMMNTVLQELGLKFDRDGQRRTSYSLRHTYICFRLMEGADIYQIAKNCRTSVEMIEKYYAAHIENVLDTTLINVRRSKGNAKIEVGTLTEELEEQAA
jgi:integrase